MKIVRYSILGLLDTSESSVDEITSYVQQKLGPFWTAQYIRIKHELEQLIEDNCIQYHDTSRSEHPCSVYTITAKGRELLQRWISQQIFSECSSTHEEFLQHSRFESCHPSYTTTAILDERIAKRQWKLKLLQARLELLKTESGAIPDSSTTQYGHYMVLIRAIEREQGYLHWLEHTLPWMGDNGPTDLSFYR